MTECWSEGALRAYLDRELATEDMQKVAAHLGECPICDGLCTELAARAAHVSALMDVLPEWTATAGRPQVVTRPRWRLSWVSIAVAVAACLALAVYLRPERNSRVAVAPPVPVYVPGPAAPVPAQATEVAVVVAPPPRPVPRRARSVRRPIEEPNEFVALDNEPFESGIIMRVGMKPGNVQADIVFGPDGRAHAFRLVSAKQRF